MDTLLIVLCGAIALVFLIALICETVRLTNSYRSLKEDEAKANRAAPRVVEVKQKQGEVRLAYITMGEGNDIREEETAAATAEATVEETAVTAEAAVEEKPAQPEEAAEASEAEGLTVFTKSERLTYEEKYEKLDETDKKLIDEFSAFVSGLDDCSSAVQTSALAFKYKKGHIAKAVIRRDTVVLNFAIANPELERVVRDGKIKDVKVKPVEIRLTGEEDLALAKQTAEITVKFLREEEEYRLAKRKEARREAAARKRAEAAAKNDGGEDGAL